MLGQTAPLDQARYNFMTSPTPPDIPNSLILNTCMQWSAPIRPQPVSTKPSLSLVINRPNSSNSTPPPVSLARGNNKGSETKRGSCWVMSTVGLLRTSTPRLCKMRSRGWRSYADIESVLRSIIASKQTIIVGTTLISDYKD